MLDFAIIGAGVSGLGAAIELKGRQVEVFEKSRGFGGRAATREIDGIHFDHGANYLSIDEDSLGDWLPENLPNLQKQKVAGAIWTFDAKGELKPGDPNRDASTKWTFTDGINSLGRALAKICPHPITREIRVAKVEPVDGGWQILDDEGKVLAQAKQLIFSTPTPQTLEILPKSFHGPAAATPTYFRQFAVMLAFDQVIEFPDNFYAGLNSDRQHCIAWFSREDCKPGRVPSGRSGLVVQLSPDWTAENFEMDKGEVGRIAQEELSRLLGRNLPTPSAINTQRWKFAHPEQPVSSDQQQKWREQGIHVCGDSTVGKGRLGASLLSGISLGKELG